MFEGWPHRKHCSLSDAGNVGAATTPPLRITICHILRTMCEKRCETEDQEKSKIDNQW